MVDTIVPTRSIAMLGYWLQTFLSFAGSYAVGRSASLTALLAWYHAEDFTYNAETVENRPTDEHFLDGRHVFGRAEFPSVRRGDGQGRRGPPGLSIVRRRRHLRRKDRVADGPGFRHA